jgi:hypothetical protein
MNPCLGEKSLARVFAGAGSESERAHLAGCATCRRHVDEIARDVDRIATALRGAAAEERHGSRAPETSLDRRWRPALAGIAAAAVLAAMVISGIPASTPEGAGAAGRAGTDRMRASVRDLSHAMFRFGEPRAAVVPQSRSSAELVNAALAGWPCGDGESFAVSCR